MRIKIHTFRSRVIRFPCNHAHICAYDIYKRWPDLALSSQRMQRLAQRSSARCNMQYANLANYAKPESFNLITPQVVTLLDLYSTQLIDDIKSHQPAVVNSTNHAYCASNEPYSVQRKRDEWNRADKSTSAILFDQASVQLRQRSAANASFTAPRTRRSSQYNKVDSI